MKKIVMDVSKELKNHKFKIAEKKYSGYQVNHFCIDYTNEFVAKKKRGDYFSILFNLVSLHKNKKGIKTTARNQKESRKIDKDVL